MQVPWRGALRGSPRLTIIFPTVGGLIPEVSITGEKQLRRKASPLGISSVAPAIYVIRALRRGHLIHV